MECGEESPPTCTIAQSVVTQDCFDRCQCSKGCVSFRSVMYCHVLNGNSNFVKSNLLSHISQVYMNTKTDVLNVQTVHAFINMPNTFRDL